MHLADAPSESKTRPESVERAVNDDVDEVIGVRNGATALVPLDAVMFGVAKAGDAMITAIDNRERIARTALLTGLTKSSFRRTIWGRRQGLGSGAPDNAIPCFGGSECPPNYDLE
jgi:hypothetical protein